MTGVSLRNVLGHAKRLRIALRAAEPLCVLTLLFGKVFFRIHFALGLEGLPVPIERKSGLDPCLVGPPYGLEMFRRETPSRPRIPCVYGLEVGVGGECG